MTPPRLATWIAQASLREAEREYVLGDLEEEFGARATHDPRGARRWYWMQVVRSVPRNLTRRWRSRSPAGSRKSSARLAGRPLHDVAYAFRLVRREPVRSGVLILTLALGLGINVALFAVVNTVVLRPLPFPEPDRLVRLWDRHDESGLSFFSVSVAHYFAWSQRVDRLAAVAAYREDGFSLAGRETARLIRGVRATATMFDVLGVRPSLGRGFNADEDRPGGPAVAVATWSFWQRELGGDPGAIGRAIAINGEPRTVVGVMPQGFRFPQQEQAELLVPYELTLDPSNRGAHFLRVLARLQEPALDVALADLNAVARQLEADDPGVEAGWTVAGLRLHDAIVGDVRATLFLLQGAGLLVLLIAVVNVANLLVVRSADRARELAVRAALGAGAGRLARQLLTESLVLAGLGSAAGLALASVGLAAGRAWLPASLPRTGDLSIDTTTIAVAAGLALLSGLLFGFAPALAATRRRGQVATVGKDGTIARAGLRGRRVLVAGQLALAVLLLSTAALLVQSSNGLARVDPGFRSTGALTFDLSPQGDAYATAERRARLYQRVEAAVATIPGVTHVGMTHRLPLMGNSSFEFRIVGQDGPEQHQANYRAISGGYFASMGIPVVAGRTFEAVEDWERGSAVIVNQTAARRFWRGRSPLGNRIVLSSGQELEIVGVVADSRESGLTSEVEPAAYVPYMALPVPAATFVVRASVDPASLARPITLGVAEVDRSLAVANLRTLADVVDALLLQPRFNSALVTVFALLAVLLAAVGISGMIGSLVAARSREFGIRLALGARSGQIIGRLLRDGMAIALAGILVGLAASTLSDRLLSGLLFGVASGDPATLAGVAAALAAVAALATIVPARRILRLDPASTLRE